MAVAHLQDCGAEDLLTGYSPKCRDFGLTNATIAEANVICIPRPTRVGLLVSSSFPIGDWCSKFRAVGIYFLLDDHFAQTLLTFSPSLRVACTLKILGGGNRAHFRTLAAHSRGPRFISGRLGGANRAPALLYLSRGKRPYCSRHGDTRKVCKSIVSVSLPAFLRWE